MMGYPRALAVRHEIARTVAAWLSAEPTDTPGRYPRVWCPRLPRDLSACHRAPPSRVTYPRALASPLPRALAAGTIPACQRYPRDIPPNLTAWPSHDTDTPSHKDYPQHIQAWRIPARRYHAGPSCAPNPTADNRASGRDALAAEPGSRVPASPNPVAARPTTRTIAEPSRRTRYETYQPNQTLGKPTLIEHPFEFAGPNRTPVRSNTRSTLHPAMLGKVTRITGNRFHSAPALNRQAGRFQSSKDCQPETEPNRTLVLSNICSTVVAGNRGKSPNITWNTFHSAQLKKSKGGSFQPEC